MAAVVEDKPQARVMARVEAGTPGGRQLCPSTLGKTGTLLGGALQVTYGQSGYVLKVKLTRCINK